MAGTNITTTGVLYINGAQVENTFTNLSKITKKLEGELKKLPIGTKEFIEKAEEVRQARARFEEVKKEIAAVNGALEKSSGVLGFFKKGLLGVGDTFKQVFSANMFERVLDGIINKGKLTVDELLNIADAMTDVQKTSGMTLEQVKKLWDGFDDMDTRTNKLDRLKIAEVGGRLGVPIEEMKSFVQEVDKAYVALGDSFEGGLEGVVDQLGKIKGLFEDTKGMTYAEAINRVGSALNTLAAQGTASEGNISQYALRMGSLPDALKPAIDKVLGLGAAFEESGIDAQIASSGTSNFLTTAAENIEAFAHSMNMGVQEAKNLINTKPEEFLLRFAEGMKGLPADQTAKIFASLKLNSLEVQKVIGAAANRTDEFRKAMKTAGVEMEKMTSLQDEFNQKNNNAPAILQKIKNAWNDIFTSTNVISNFEWLIQLIGFLTGVTNEAGDGIKIFKDRIVFLWEAVKVITVAILGYNAGLIITTIATGNLTKSVLLNNIALKAKAIQIWIVQAASLVWNVTLGLLTGNLARARVAMISFNLATKANPIGLLISLLGAAVTAYFLFRKEAEKNIIILNKVATAAKVAGDIQRNIAKEEAAAMGDLKKKTELLLAIIKDKNTSLATRKKAYENLIAIYPEFKGTLDSEYNATDKLTSVYDKLILKLKEVSTVRAYQKLLDQAADKRVQAEQAKINAEFAKKDEELNNKEIETRNKNRAKQSESERKIIKGVGDKFDRQAIGVREAMAYEQPSNVAAKAFINIAKDFQNADNEYDEVLKRVAGKKEIADALLNNGGSETNAPGKNTVAPDKKKNREAQEADKMNSDLEKAREAYNKALEDKTKSIKELLDLQRNYEDEQFKIIQENKKKELELEEQSYKRRVEDIIQNNEKINDEIRKSEAKIETLKYDKDHTKSKKAKILLKAAIDKEEANNVQKQELIKKNNDVSDQYFQTYGWNVLRIEEKWEIIRYQKKAEALQAASDLERKSAEDMINNMSTMEEAKRALSQMQFLKLTDQELAGIKTLEDAKKALRENADRAYLDSQIKLIDEQKKLLVKLLQDPSLSPEAVGQLKKHLDELNTKTTQLKSSLNGGSEADDKKVKEESDAEKTKIDILGFSAKDWEDAFDNLDTTAGKIKAAQMAVQALTNAFAMFGQLQENLNKREMASFEKNQDKKKKDLLKQLNQGFINQEEYHKQLELLDAQKANKEAEMAYKTAKMQRAVQVASAIASTALGVASALAMNPWTPANFVLASVVGALGAAQIGIIASQPLPDKPSFDVGGFTGDGFGSPDQSGFKPAGIVHENEWVAPKWMLESPRTAKVIDYLESVRMGKTKPMADGGFVDENKPVVSQNSNSGNAASDPQLMFVLSQLSEILEYLKDNGVDAWMVEDAENGKRIKRTIKKFEQIETRASGK